MIANAIYENKWYIWLTNWSFLFVALYFVCATTVTAIHYKKERKRRAQGNNQGTLADTADSNRNSNNRCEPSYELQTGHVSDDGEVIFIAEPPEASREIPMAWFHEALWVIYNIASTAALLVTLTFWLLIFNSSDTASAIVVIFHGVNAVVMVIDTSLSSIPVRLFHVIYPMLYCIAYIIFTVIYWAAGMPYIYPQTDYTGRPVLSAVSQLCIVFIGIPLCQSVMFGFYRLRVWMKNRCRK